MQLSTDAVVVREKRLEEQDRLLTLLTRDQGVITAYAKGAARIKGGMVSSTELLCYSHFKLFQNKDRAFVDGAESDTVFFGIRQDLEKLSLATYFCQLCCELVPPLDRDEGYLRLMLNALYYLEKEKMPRAQLKSLFELRILSMSGYMPDLVACSVCGELSDGELWFSPLTGVIYCGGCHPKSDPTPIPLSTSTFEAMRYIIYSDFDKLFSFRISPQSAHELGLVSRAYLLAQVEKMLPALNYYETIIINHQ